MTSALNKNGSTRKWRKLRAAILRRDNHVCYWCGKHATTVDHLTPRAIEPSDSPTNLVAACTTCNYRRGGQLAQAMRKQKPNPFLATGTTPVRLSLSANLSIPPGVSYSVSKPTEREKKNGN